MKRFGMLTGVLLAAFALMPGQAQSALELDMGFDPAQACPGEQVNFFFSLENVGDAEEMVTLSVTVSFGDLVIGPVEGQFPLAAGEEIAWEFGIMLPPPTPPGTLVIEATATDSDGSVEAIAELEIVDCKTSGAKKSDDGKKLLKEIRKSLREQGLK
jgi:hypothetical protein